jgi:SPP1 gp7 family putative phage head morphogenesis protein
VSQFDERFTDRPRTVNEKLIHEWLRHAHRLERVTATEVRRIERFLESDVLPDIMGKLVSRLERIQSRGYDAGIDTTQRFSDMADAIMEIVDEGVRQVAKSNAANLKDLSKYEARWQAQAIERAFGPDITLNLSLPAPGVLRELVSTRPIAGYNVGEWWDTLTVDTTRRIEQQVRIGLAEGEAVPEIARRIRGTAALKGSDGVFAITNRHAKAIARNASIHTSNQARQELYKANEDVVKGERWVATLDLRTCPKCGALDGKVFPVGEGPMPPAHPPGPSGGACRCARAPVVRSLNELADARGSKRKRLKGFGPGTRASMGGQVSATMSYSQWLKTLDPAELTEALGASRARLFSAGELTLDRMVDQSGRTLSLEQLSKLEGIDL